MPHVNEMRNHPHGQEDEVVDFSWQVEDEILIKKGRVSEAQILGVLHQAEGGLRDRELGREHVISNAMFYKWPAYYCGMAA